MLINDEERSYLSRWKKGARLWLNSMLASITYKAHFHKIFYRWRTNVNKLDKRLNKRDQKVDLNVSLILIKFHEKKKFGVYIVQ